MRIRDLGILIVMTAVLVTSCGKKETEQKLEKAKGQLKDSKGRVTDIYYGGVFKVNEIEEFTNLFPHAVTDVYSHRIANQVYQGLVKLDQEDLEVIPSIAYRWDVEEGATVFVYHLREGVKFHDDVCFEGGEGRTVTANDFKYCLDRLCSYSGPQDPTNLLGGMVLDKIIGAREYYESVKNGSPLDGGVPGIQALDDSTLRIELSQPYATFNMIMTTPAGWVFPKEAFEKYGKEMREVMVGTGPFVPKKVQSDLVVLERNENYWEVDEFGNQLPYLKGIKVTFLKDKKQELTAFQEGKYDMVFQLPVDQIENVMASFDELKQNEKVNEENEKYQFDIQISNALNLEYYAFKLDHPIFKDVRVRKAFNLAINRISLVDHTLSGEGDPAEFGIVPPLNSYPNESVQGFPAKGDPDEARRLLKEAGYPNGRGFPEITLQLNSGGSTNKLVAERIQGQLNEVLGITIKFDMDEMSQHRMKIETGQAEFWRLGWISDYPDAENFLNLFHSKHIAEEEGKRSFLNASGYVNPVYDSLYNTALRTTDATERNRIFAEADQLLIDDAVIIPIYYDNYIRLLKPRVVNFPNNAMEYRDFTRVFFKKDAEEQ